MNFEEKINQLEHDFPAEEAVSPDLLKLWKETFALFDYDETGHIKTEDLGTVIRGCGYNVTEEQISTFINSFDLDNTGLMDFETFYQILIRNQPLKGPCTMEEVRDHFATFDIHHEGSLPAEQFVDLLRNMGEPLPTEDVNHLLQEITIEDGRIHIDSLIQHMFETSAV